MFCVPSLGFYALLTVKMSVWNKINQAGLKWLAISYLTDCQAF